MDNDANVAALGEKHKGAGQGANDVVAITLGTGLGGGIISNGEIVHGHNGSGAEIGHIRTDLINVLIVIVANQDVLKLLLQLLEWLI